MTQKIIILQQQPTDNISHDNNKRLQLYVKETPRLVH